VNRQVEYRKKCFHKVVNSVLPIVLFWLCPWVGLVCWGQRQMCAMCGGNRNSKFFCSVRKN